MARGTRTRSRRRLAGCKMSCITKASDTGSMIELFLRRGPRRLVPTDHQERMSADWKAAASRYLQQSESNSRAPSSCSGGNAGCCGDIETETTVLLHPRRE